MAHTFEQGRIPEPLGQPSGQTSAIIAAPTPRFILFWHPERWIVMGGRVIPYLHKHPIQPGLAGVDSKGRYRFALSAKEERGWHMIPEDIDGEGTSYVREHDGNRGKVYLHMHERVWPGSQHIGTDEDGYVEWCTGLMDEGHIEPPAVHVLERMAESLRHTAGDLAGKVSQKPLLQRSVDMLTDKLRVVEELLEERRQNGASRGTAVVPVAGPQLPEKSAKAMVALVADTDDAGLLREWLAIEEDGKSRISVVGAITKRLDEVA